MNKLTEKNLLGFMVLAGIFLGGVSVAGFHGTKLLQFGSLVFDAGILTISLTFLCTDIISETYGRGLSRKLIIAGLFAIIAVAVFTTLNVALPGAAEWELASEYGAIMGQNLRILLAVVVAYTCSQLTDIYIFAKLKKATGGKLLWLRNNISTMTGGLVDAILFSTIAFYGTYEILPIIISAYIVRIAVSLIDTPIVYLGVWGIRKIHPELK